jgi:hypothetical protein
MRQNYLVEWVIVLLLRTNLCSMFSKSEFGLWLTGGLSMKKMVSSILTLSGMVLIGGCAQDSLGRWCTFDESSFDIEEVSVLEDAMGEVNVHDAIVLDYDVSSLSENATWRVGSVDVMIMVPQSQFAQYPESITLAVEVFDTANPKMVTPWVVEQVLNKDDLNWEDVTLTSPDLQTELTQKQAWWSFDFTDVIPETGMTSTTYMVGLYWRAGNLPSVGYSNFNRPCERNWTDYSDGLGWILNSERFTGLGTSQPNSCNWPMLRVNVEVREERSDCP